MSRAVSALRVLIPLGLHEVNGLPGQVRLIAFVLLEKRRFWLHTQFACDRLDLLPCGGHGMKGGSKKMERSVGCCPAHLYATYMGPARTGDSL